MQHFVSAVSGSELIVYDSVFRRALSIIAPRWWELGKFPGRQRWLSRAACVHPPIQWITGQDKKGPGIPDLKYPCYQAIARQIGLQSRSSSGRPIMEAEKRVQSKCEDRVPKADTKHSFQWGTKWQQEELSHISQTTNTDSCSCYVLGIFICSQLSSGSRIKVKVK